MRHCGQKCLHFQYSSQESRQELNTQRSFIKNFDFEDFNLLNRILNIKEIKYKDAGDPDNANKAGALITG